VALSTKTSDGTGVGSFTSTLASLTGSTTYYVRAYATNSVGTAYGNEVSFTTSAPFSCGTSSVSDIDGNTYTTVSIGTQCWMGVNLKTTRYRNGGSIPNVTDRTAWSNLLIPGTGAWSNYGNITPNNDFYGKLYNFYTTSGDTLCPTGWHVPSDSEWNKLVKFIHSGADTSSTSSTQSSQAGSKMKSTGTTYWASPNTDADNLSGFSARSGGYRNDAGDFINEMYQPFFWSATYRGTNQAWSRYLVNSSGSVVRISSWGTLGAYIRCLKD
jgi:uncharacterized protein (TIGR02145 family)